MKTFTEFANNAENVVMELLQENASLKRQVEQATLTERERCAKLCEDHPLPNVSGSHGDGYGAALDDCAAAIRKG